jgi:hypothetical protein
MCKENIFQVVYNLSKPQKNYDHNKHYFHDIAFFIRMFYSYICNLNYHQLFMSNLMHFLSFFFSKFTQTTKSTQEARR